MARKKFYLKKKRFSKRKSLSYGKSMIGKINYRKIETTYPVFAYFNAVSGAEGYTLDGTGTATTLLSFANLFSVVAGTNSFTNSLEFIQATRNFLSVKMHGVSMCFRRSLNVSSAGGTWTNLPPFYATIVPYLQNIANQQTAYCADNRYVCQVLNTSDNPHHKYYALPPSLVVGNSFVIGSKVWNSSQDMLRNSNYGIFLLIDTENDVTTTSLLTANQQIGHLDLILYSSWGVPTLTALV